MFIKALNEIYDNNVFWIILDVLMSLDLIQEHTF